ncbi:MAG: RidA family protein [Hellea sp.]|nr:RidA family protein [Hellea sp.]
MPAKKKADPKRKLISMGSNGEKNYSFSRAVVQGDWCFVAGTVGDDYNTGEIPESVVQQAHNTFANIMAAMKAGGFELGHAVRVQYTVSDRKYIPEVRPVLKQYFGEIRPAATMVVADLVDPKMKIEIEVTAYKG